mgnify:CR=1 FL=1
MISLKEPSTFGSSLIVWDAAHMPVLLEEVTIGEAPRRIATLQVVSPLAIALVIWSNTMLFSIRGKIRLFWPASIRLGSA